MYGQILLIFKIMKIIIHMDDKSSHPSVTKMYIILLFNKSKGKNKTFNAKN